MTEKKVLLVCGHWFTRQHPEWKMTAAAWCLVCNRVREKGGD